MANFHTENTHETCIYQQTTWNSTTHEQVQLGKSLFQSAG